MLTFNKLSIYCFFIIIPMTANAGLFGPSNWEECVLDRMKGQDPSMAQTARAACWIAFPLKPVEHALDPKNIKSEWCESGRTRQVICIRDKPKTFRITKIEAYFYAEKCESTQGKTPVTVVAEKSFFSSNFEFQTPADNYQCAYQTYFGFSE